MNDVHKQILHEWFNNDVTISYLVEKYLPNMRKEVILLIRDNISMEDQFRVVNEEPKKRFNKSMKKDISIPKRKDSKGKRQTEHMIEQTIYMPHALKGLLEQEYISGGWSSMSEIVRSAISNYFLWLESNSANTE